MNWWQYLIPDNPVALGIWYFLLAMFVIWLLLLILEYVKLFGKRKQIKDSESVESLEDILKRQIALRNSNVSTTGTERLTASDTNGGLNFEAALVNFYQTAGVKEDSIVAEHIRAIFFAGWNNSQLQIESLIKNTANRLFNRNGLLRSSLSLFIILGLLGTLFGLAHSLAQLSPFIPSGSQLSNNTAVQAQGLSNLLHQLRGAFAPSILGVGCTILGVLLFSFYLHGCQSVKDGLERLTLTDWVPKLYPSPFQQQLSTLVQTEELIRQNRENIQTVADFAANIKTDVEGFGSEIRNAKTTLKNLNKSSSQINEFADKFHESVERLVPFQEELSRLYQKMLEDSKVFQEGVSQSLFNTTEVQRQARDTLTQQSQQLKEVIDGLRSYEEAYVKSRQELDATLKTVMEDARKAYHDIGGRNKEIAAAIDESLSVPLRKDLTAKLSEVNETLTAKLGSIVDSTNRFDRPIEAAADKFGQLVQTIVTQTGELMARLQHEYNKQNDANEEQLQRLESLNSQLVSFLEALTKVTSQQENSYTNLSKGLPSLEGKLTTVTQSLERLINKDIPPHDTGGVINTSGIERRIQEAAAHILTEIDKLVRINEEIRRIQSSSNGRRRDAQTQFVAATVESNDSRESGARNPTSRVYDPPIEMPRKGIVSKFRAAWRRFTGG
jgi:hypothetical protein